MASKIFGRGGSVKEPGAQAAGDSDNEDAVAAAADIEPAPWEGADPAQPLVMTAAQLQAAISRGVNSALAARDKAAAPQKEADLPDQSEIDPTTIKRPTLSKQGYVVPATYGEPADPSIKR